MVTVVCCHGYGDMLSWLRWYVAMVTVICCHGYVDMYYVVMVTISYVVMVTVVCCHGYSDMLSRLR